MTISVVFFDLGETLVQSPAAWVPGAKGVLDALRSKGLRLGIISNTAQLTREQILQQLPADFTLAIFEPKLVLFSSEVGIEKPALAIFYVGLQRAEVDASQCLFCTENPTDALAAQRSGMIAIRLLRPPNSDIVSLVSTGQAAGLWA